MTQNTPTLHRLSDTTLVLASEHEDIRGRRVFDADRAELGTIEDLIVDDVERRIRFLQVASGGFLGVGRTRFLIPILAVTRIEDDAVHISATREQVAAGPAYDPELTELPSMRDIVPMWPYL